MGGKRKAGDNITPASSKLARTGPPLASRAVLNKAADEELSSFDVYHTNKEGQRVLHLNLGKRLAISIKKRLTDQGWSFDPEKLGVRIRSRFATFVEISGERIGEEQGDPEEQGSVEKSRLQLLWSALNMQGFIAQRKTVNTGLADEAIEQELDVFDFESVPSGQPRKLKDLFIDAVHANLVQKNVQTVASADMTPMYKSALVLRVQGILRDEVPGVEEQARLAKLIEAFGVKVAADVEYLCNVYAALGEVVPPALSSFMKCTMLGVDDYTRVTKEDAEDLDAAVVAAVAKMRAIKD